MRKYLAFLVFYLVSHHFTGQNLINDGNMDSIKQNYFVGLATDDLIYWRNNTGKDLTKNISIGTVHYDKCNNGGACPGSNVSPGDNLPLPFAGNGYSFLSFYNLQDNCGWTPSMNTNTMSIAKNKMRSQLLSDTIYCFEMYVQFYLANVCLWSSYTHDKLGAYFSIEDSLPSAFPWQDGIVPQVGNFGYILNDTAWQRLNGSFIANGGEQYVYIGNFDPYGSPPFLHPNALDADSIGAIFFDAVYVYNCRDTLFKVVQKDTTVCWGQPVQLQPNLQGFKLQDSVRSYYWKTPGGNFTSADSTFTATAQGNYTVTVTLNKRFTATTNFTITWVPEAPDTALLPDSLVLCPGEPRLLEAPEIPGARYRWSNGDTTRYSTIGLPGLYTLQVITPCWLHTENVLAYQSPCGTRIFIPNAFTPDGDGTNDYFEIFGPIEPFTLIVTDRWGKVVYQSEDYKNDWDGTYQGEPLPAGVYNFRIVYAKYVGGPKNYDQVGTVTLIR